MTRQPYAPPATPEQPVTTQLTTEVPGVTRLSAWPKSVKPKDQDKAAETGVRHVPVVEATATK